MLSNSLSNSLSLTSDTLKIVLKSLEEEDLPSLPTKLETLVASYAVTFPSSLVNKYYPGRVVAETLGLVWRDHLYPHLNEIDADPKDWFAALSPVALYLAPLLETGRFELRFTSENALSRAKKRLGDPKWVGLWVQDVDLVGDINKQVLSSIPSPITAQRTPC